MDGMDRYADTQIDRQTDRQTDRQINAVCQQRSVIAFFIFPIFVRNMCRSCAEFRASVALAPR